MGLEGLCYPINTPKASFQGIAPSWKLATMPDQEMRMDWNVFSAPAETMFVEYLQGLAQASHLPDPSAATLEEWQARKSQLRAYLARSLGSFPPEPCSLDAQVMGSLERENYRIERLVFRSRPHVYVTANLYLPKQVEGPAPAILGVHGHWATGKIEPVVQSRALGLVQRGYVVLNVDAFGAGERGRQPGQFEYHGARIGAALWPVGTPLIGMQVYDNIRAIDYLCSRPEVDPTRIGCTGASGGGNQTMWIAALDERIQAAVPVCSVGTFESYIGSANCVCETLPDGLTYAEEGDVLALVAPRALLLINATHDARCFSIEEMRRSFNRARPVFQLFGAEAKLAKYEVEASHGYNQQMREAMYGWFDRWLKGEGNGRPVPERPHQTEDPQALKCFPEDRRPEDFETIPSFAYHRARLLRQARSQEWQASLGKAFRQAKQQELVQRWGGWLEREPLAVEAAGVLESYGTTVEKFSFLVEPGLRLPALFFHAPTRAPRIVLLLHPDGKAAAAESELAHELLIRGQAVFTFDLRGIGETRWPGDALGDVPDHNSSRAALWLGRPLLGMWVWDVCRALDYLETREDVGKLPLALCGLGPLGLVALSTAAVDSRCAATASVGALASFVQREGYPAQPMGVLMPGFLEWGDIAHLAALIAPRRLLLANGVNGAGEALGEADLQEQYAEAWAIYHRAGKDEALIIQAGMAPAEVAAWITASVTIRKRET